MNCTQACGFSLHIPAWLPNFPPEAAFAKGLDTGILLANHARKCTGIMEDSA